MRTVTENKSIIAAAGGSKCPQCGRKGGACRTVPMGHWCQRDGLAADPERVIYPDPDPIHAAVGRDVSVLAARLEEGTAQAQYDKAHESWLSALSALSTAKLGGGVQVVNGEYRHSRRDVKREARLIEAQEEAKRQREKAGEALIEARVRHQKALKAARWRLTGEYGA